MPATPDPTVLTTNAVNQAVEVARRDIVALRETLETRIDGMDRDRQRIWDQLEKLPGMHEVSNNHLRDELIQRDVHGREVITQRLNDLDAAASVVTERIERTHADFTADIKAAVADFRDSMRSEREYIISQQEVLKTKLTDLDTAVKWRDEVAARIRAELAEQITHLRSIHDKDLASIAVQFRERDARFDREAVTAREALAVALTSAKEQVALQTAADARASEKSETSFTKQFDAISARVDELKERLAESGGHAGGIQSERTEHRLSQGAIISMIIAGAATIGLIITIVSLILKH